MHTITLARGPACKTIPTGFSWTTFLFGIWPSIVRGHWKFAWIALIADLGALIAIAYLQAPDAAFVFAFIARMGLAGIRNDELLRDLVADGWVKTMAIRKEAWND